MHKNNKINKNYNNKDNNEKSQRQLQIGENIKRIISEIFLREDILKLNNKYITISKVDVSPDAKNAKIYIDIFFYNNHISNQEIDNNDKSLTDKNNNKNLIIDLLNSQSGHFRYQLAKKITLRNIPNISFILDKSQDNINLISTIIDQENNKA
jgi:ribosome-binding factor A